MNARHAFQQWQIALGKAVQGNDQNLNFVLGNLPTFATDSSTTMQVPDVQQGAVQRLIRGGAVVFDAITRNQTALRNLITTGETTFATTAANNKALAATSTCSRPSCSRRARPWRECRALR